MTDQLLPRGVVRTRIAPSPTGFLHLGTARTALYSWAYARHHGGQFVLRIEDTDVARSTQDSVDQILQSMDWLGLRYDEGPVYQMQRLDRYHAVIREMLAAGTAYRCWCTPQELDQMREGQKARGEKTRYDGRWRPAPGKVLPPAPTDVMPAIRFANPLDGAVVWEDLVKGPISISNAEIDDLILLRPADPTLGAEALGVPTYNFAVVVDDWDMGISHVFRGDEHINNTPWQINLYRALGAQTPAFGHLPIILGDDGQKLSKRRGAVSVTAYEDAGYLPEGMLNYLARLGWSHGDDEIFSAQQMVQWFDGTHLAKSPAQWDAAKLAWVNGQHLRAASDDRLAVLVRRHLMDVPDLPPSDSAVLQGQCGLFKDRCSTLVELSEWIRLCFVPATPDPEWLTNQVPPTAQAALQALVERLQMADWTREGIAAALKQVLQEQGLKMPQLAMPLRAVLFGRTQTPAVDAMLSLMDKNVCLARLRSV